MKLENKRTHNQLRRVLTLIDAIAHFRMPFTLQDAIHALEEKSGTKARVCERTIQRDLELLVSMNFAHIHRKYKPIGLGSQAGALPVQYKMDLPPNSNILRAAQALTQKSN